jgi:hypothetical protein
MDLADFLLDVAYHYSRAEDMASPTQQLLKSADVHLAEHVPAGIVIKGSGGKGTPTFTPWVGFFDPDETETPENGIYVVLLFAEDLASVTLTLNQGITRLTNEVGPGPARQRLAEDAARIREHMPPTELAGLDSTFDLGSSGFRQMAYQAAASLPAPTSSTPCGRDTTAVRPGLVRPLVRAGDPSETLPTHHRARGSLDSQPIAGAVATGRPASTVQAQERCGLRRPHRRSNSGENATP